MSNNLELKNSLKIERYKIVTELQKYFTELAKDSINSYVKIFVSFAAAAVGLIYFKQQLEFEPMIDISLLKAIYVLLTLVAVMSIIQIIFCLVRWYGLRNSEHDINSECSPLECWAWEFEGLYALAIIGSIYVVWYGFDHFSKIIT